MNHTSKDIDHSLDPTVNDFMPGISVDNVIFGFHDQQLKVLLLECADQEHWMLPGGYVIKTESVNDAAKKVLTARTGLSEVYLQQFGVFGGLERSTPEVVNDFLSAMRLDAEKFSWHLERFITIGFFALVEFQKVNPKPDAMSLSCQWFDLHKLPKMIFDHSDLVDEALKTMRVQLRHQPIGYNLLPEEFTLKDLRTIYETILDRKIDRANFNRKMLSLGILHKKEKLFTGGAHKAPYLYSFDEEAYFDMLNEGFALGF